MVFSLCLYTFKYTNSFKVFLEIKNCRNDSLIASEFQMKSGFNSTLNV